MLNKAPQLSIRWYRDEENHRPSAPARRCPTLDEPLPRNSCLSQSIVEIDTMWKRIAVECKSKTVYSWSGVYSVHHTLRMDRWCITADSSPTRLASSPVPRPVGERAAKV